MAVECHLCGRRLKRGGTVEIPSATWVQDVAAGFEPFTPLIDMGESAFERETAGGTFGLPSKRDRTRKEEIRFWRERELMLPRLDDTRSFCASCAEVRRVWRASRSWKQPSRCDLCGADLGTAPPQTTAQWMFQNAVAGGFDPFSQPGLDMEARRAAIAGLEGNPSPLAYWRTLALWEEGDWTLCQRCDLGFTAWLGKLGRSRMWARIALVAGTLAAALLLALLFFLAKGR
ncbi:MAG: hypothetical protein HY823_01400 [Acidobacteria bacterium]|nr:hypothetical protein [Acidobacteriota bacterium]